MFLLNILGELVFLAALVLELYAFLSPVPWFSTDLGASLINFTPYVQPQGYAAPNPCSYPSLTNVSAGAVNITHAARAIDGPWLRFRRSPLKISSEVPTSMIRRDASAGNNSHVAIWIGPLGTCSRDADGSVHCTKSSYSNPQYNLSYVQANSVFYSSMMPGVIKRKSIAGLVGLNVVGFLFYLLGSYPFWFPVFFSRAGPVPKNDREIWPILAFFWLVLSGCAQFFVNFTIHVGHIGDFNTVDNFYLPAPCGAQRPLKSGLLLHASAGNSYLYMWASWCLIYLFSMFFLLYRSSWCGGNFEEYVEERRDRKIKADEEKATKEARKKAEKGDKEKREEEERLRQLVEKEKVAIRAREELEAEKTAEKANEKTESIVSDDSVSVTAPPYSPKPGTVSV